jgi:hypothetical protein
MTKRILIAISIFGLSGAAALAQTVTPPVAPQPTPGVSTTPQATLPTTTPGDAKAQGKPMMAEETPPLSGANSFTETQVRDRVIASGFTTVDGLKKDASGIWRGMGTKAGKQMSVAVDFKGNIVVTQ